MPGARSKPVAGVVLAAGGSARMGRNKLLLELEGETLIRRSVRRAIAAGLDPVVVVLGFEAASVARELRGLECRSVTNARHARGQHGSVKRGLAALPSDAEAALLLLADMPFVSTEMIRSVVARYRESTAPLVLSRYGDVTAPPTLYGRSLFPELCDLDDSERTRGVARRHADEALIVSWPGSDLADLDTPQDHERIKARLDARGKLRDR